MVNNMIQKVLLSHRDINNNYNKTIGSMLKHYRLNKNLTLEDVSKDICSISYLCKVENNQIVPSEKNKPKLFERLEINEEDFTYQKSNQWIKNILHKQYVCEKLFLKVKDKRDYQSKLITYAYYTFNELNTNEGYNYSIELLSYAEFLSIDELGFYLYLNLRNDYNNQRFLEVVDCYTKIKNLPNNYLINIYSMVIVAKSLYRLNIYKEALLMTEEVNKKLLDLNQFDLIIELKNYQLASQAKNLNTESFEKKLLLISEDTNYNIDYINFCHSYYYLMDFNKAFNYIKKIYKAKQHYYIMYLLTLDKLKKRVVLSNAINNPPFNELKVAYEIVLNYLKFKYHKNLDVNLIAKELLINEKIIQENSIRIYLNSEVERFFQSKHYYKDLTELLKNKKNYLKRCLNLAI